MNPPQLLTEVGSWLSRGAPPAPLLNAVFRFIIRELRNFSSIIPHQLGSQPDVQVGGIVKRDIKAALSI